MDKKTAAKLLIFIREIETEIDAIAGILDSMDAILDDAAGANCGRRGHCGQSGHGGQGAGAEAAAQEPERLPDVPDWRDTEAGKRERVDLVDRGLVRMVTDRDGMVRRARKTCHGGLPKRAGKDGAAQFAADDRLTRIRLIVAAHQGDGLSEIISAILADGIKPAELAGLLSVHQARISEALHGHARPGFVARFAEVLGEGGDANLNGENGENGGNGGRAQHGMANCRGKRGQKNRQQSGKRGAK